MTVSASDRSAGSTLGFIVSGDVTKADYDEVLDPAVASAIAQSGEVSVMLDLTGLRSEKVGAWGADLHFGHEYHDKISRMAIVGDKKWEQHLAHLAAPFYAKQPAYFDDQDAALTWLNG